MSKNLHTLIQAAASHPLTPKEKKERLSTLMHYKEQLHELKAADAPLDLIIITLFDLAELYARLGHTPEARRYYLEAIDCFKELEQDYLTFLETHPQYKATQDELQRIQDTIQSLFRGTYYDE